MRTFHIFILAYALAILGCGYKTMPYWKDDTPKQEPQTQQEKIPTQKDKQ